MKAAFLMLALSPLAYGSQVTVVDLSGVRAGSPQGQTNCYMVSGGGVARPDWKPPREPIRLVLTRIITETDGPVVRYSVEAVMTNTGDAPLSIPVGTDAESLLAPGERDRQGLMFIPAVGQDRKQLCESEAVAASNAGHPETLLVLEPGDAALFLLPVGSWPPGKEPKEEVSVSFQRERKVIEKGTDCVAVRDEPMHSENSLALPAAKDP
ncbi:MAG TPA: hypothetical protein VMT86_03655 [Bryobacteraceae bacterium]|nr:hypothetical protein [Bryobacteraceae bacterium]